VLAAFNNLLDGIRHADVKAVTNAYQNTPRLVLFNYNGTVTKGWDQMKANRESSYPQMKDVTLEIRDLRVTMLGRDAALITCQWTQSMTFRGVPETDTGRMTIVFRKIGKDWKAIHLHTSNDNPDPSRVPPSEQVTPPPNQ
jgi:ketosteroid isomerase-like protein